LIIDRKTNLIDYLCKSSSETDKTPFMSQIFTSKMKFLDDFLLSGKHIHPLAIMMIDILMIFLSFSLSYIIVASIGFQQARITEYAYLIGIYFLTAIPVIYLWRLHSGLLRFSNTLDLFRVIGAVSTFSILLLILLVLYGTQIDGKSQVPYYFVLLINFFICTSFLIVFRLSAKSAYMILTRNFSNNETHRVLIYGSDKDAVLVKQALESDEEINYVICGFIDTDRRRLNSYLEQKKVYHFKDLTHLKRKKKIDEILIVNENLDERSKKVVIERCIRLGIKVFTIPPTRNWLSGKINKKQIKQLRIEDLLQRPPIQINQEKVKNDLYGKRILITGAAGSIGSEIVRQVITYEPALLILCDQAESPLHDIQLEIEDRFPNAVFEIVLMDVNNLKRMNKLFDAYHPELVYHAAAYKHVPMVENNPFEAVSVNVGGTKNVADLSIKFGVDKFVMVSTDKAVNPTNVMGASKRLAEIYVQSLNSFPEGKTRFITTRFGNVLGSNGSVIPRFRSQIENGGPVTVTHPEITRYFMTISEAVQLVLEAGTTGKGGEIYVFDMGKPVKIVDLARKMIRLAGLVEGKDIKIVYSGLRPGEKLYEELLAQSELTLPTHHEKIKVAKVRSFKYEEALKVIEELLSVNKLNDNEVMVAKMKEIVPEFLSKNSIYESLDIHNNEVLEFKEK
jgi:FlaA1/EpsC-like NDP-sugar epimerase